jgi:hypothetical protein
LSALLCTKKRSVPPCHQQRVFVKEPGFQKFLSETMRPLNQGFPGEQAPGSRKPPGFTAGLKSGQKSRFPLNPGAAKQTPVSFPKLGAAGQSPSL